MEKNLNFFDYCGELVDPRIERKKLHNMFDILFLTLCGVIVGCEGWGDIENYGKARLDFLRRYRPFEHGVPSDDTLRRFFRAIDPTKFGECFANWVKSIIPSTHNLTINIDGKTLKGSKESDDKKAIHMISAFVSELRLVLCQKKVDAKDNEITAIPDLLEALDLLGAIVTIDAMGCQKKIAKIIRSKGADYVLALKENQKDMHEQVETFFELEGKNDFKNVSCDIATTIEKNGGRIEKRKCIVTGNIDCIEKKNDWEDLNTIVCIESEREIKGVKTFEKRYYISSLPPVASKLLLSVRSHWAIENSLHYVLDVSFGEDNCRIKKGNAPQNISIIRHLIINAINRSRNLFHKRLSIKAIRKLASWDDTIMATILSLF